MEYPLTYGVFSATIWAVLGIVTSFLYGIIGYCLATWVARSGSIELKPPPTMIDEPSDARETSAQSVLKSKSTPRSP